MVGIGRAAKNGILIKGGSTLEELAGIKNIVFDKTGTLTTGDFRIKNINVPGASSEKEIIDALFNMEQHSSHPIAKSIVTALRGKTSPKKFSDIREEKGLGISARDEEGNFFQIGSFRMAGKKTSDNTHNIYILKNDKLIGTVDIEDSVKPCLKEAMNFFRSKNISPVLLSGDTKKKCQDLALQLGIEKVFAEQRPADKLSLIEKLVKESPAAMVGDGINDAPALARSTVGISLSNATQVAIQSAQVILLRGKDLSQLVEAYKISTHTLLTIRQNLFWAFFYNVAAIPIAAAGFLSPMVGALSMAFSDVIVIGNSIRLKSKKLR
jgi:Cu+-exporting ATPase